MNIEVQRLKQVPDNSEYRATTTGVVFIDGRQLCFSLEPTALMIPEGNYPVKMEWSLRFDRMTPHLLNVTGRTDIEIHGGNHATDSEGCILVAEKRIDDYSIYESKPATDSIEEALNAAEANGETNSVQISGGTNGI